MTIPIARLCSLGVVLLLLAHVPSAMGAGNNLFWNDCGNSGTGVTNRNFACNTNVGANVLVVSFDPPAGITTLSGINFIIDLQSQSSPLPQWWRFKNAGTCRMSSMTANTDFPTLACLEPWASPGNAGIAAYTDNYGGDPRRARIVGSIATVSGNAPVDPGYEYYAANLSINNARTVGDGSCAGCLDPVCLVLLQVRLAQPAPNPTWSIENPLWSSYATWQNGAINTFGCPGGSPVANRTWGQVKGLYR